MKPVFQHRLIIADHAIFRHAPVGLGIAITYVRIEIGMDPPLPHMNVTDLFANSHYLTGTLMAKHGGIGC